MSDERRYTKEEEIHRAERAKTLLEDEIMVEVFATVAQDFQLEWLEGKTVEEREAAWAKTHALGAVRRELRRIVSDGEYARRGA